MSVPDERFSNFDGVMTSLDDVRSVIGEAPPTVLAKVIDHLDSICRDFIARSPFVIIASANSAGQLDVSPKGDPAGFVRVLDEKYLAIPDRPGNRRVDTFTNLLENPRVGLIFLVPGKGETLRVSGEARIVRDLALRESMAVQGHTPEFALVVYVEQAFVHCPKCVVRSKLWQSEGWMDPTGLARIDEAMIQHARLKMTREELKAYSDNAGITRLY